MSPPKKYKELNLRQKVSLLSFLETHSERKAAEEFGISKTTVHQIKKRKLEYQQRYESENDSMKRKRTKTNFDCVNEATLRWFNRVRAMNGRVSGPMLQETALQFANKFKCPEFKASNGWLDKFKIRNQISQKTLSGESNETSQEVVTNFKTKFPEYSKGFEERDIFNADECGLFFKAMPDKSLVMKGDQCKSGKIAKERLTVLLAASMVGEKLKPLVIGRANKPRAFKNVNVEQLPVTWRSNMKAWMTSAIFEAWIKDINKDMKKQKRLILMTIDNCPAHPEIRNISNVTIKFLPPNTTAMIQPLDQGVIKNFKVFYRQLLLNSVIAESTSTNVSELARKINVLDAVG